MEQKYDATYRFPGSKAVVHIVAPQALAEEAKAIILREAHMAAWAGWSSISVEERLKINLGIDLAKILQRRVCQLSLKAE